MSVHNNRYPSDAVAVTPSDTAPVDFVGLYVGGAGNVAVMGDGGVAVTFTAPPVGSVIHLHITTVMATGTTATNLVGLKA